MELCEQAEVQDDPAKLADLADEIYEILGLAGYANGSNILIVSILRT